MAIVTAMAIFSHNPAGAVVRLTAGETVPALRDGEVDRLTALGAITADAPTKAKNA